jgi:acetyltransferase-like isoleucine patch superfamily enzyme
MNQFYKVINTLYNLTDSLLWKVTSLFWTFIVATAARSRGIVLGRECIFYGYTKFKKANNATISIGKKVTFRSSPTSNLIGVNRPCIITALDPDAKLKIGNYCGFSGTVIGSFSKITIGDHVKCGANTLITDGDWHTDDYRSGKSAPILIEDNVWLGVNVTVLKGVTIGENTIIGANSVVVKSIPSNSVAAGNPCRVLKEISKQV